jgi:hypothetical protein
MKTVNYKVRFINKYPTPIEIYAEKQVEVYMDIFCFDPIPKDMVRIIMMVEPLRGDLFDLVQKYRDYYDYVLTYEDEILKSNSKAILFHCTDTWVKGFVPPERKFCVSTVVGGKNDLRMKGYAMRHELWNRQNEVLIPKEFFLSSQCKYPLADYNHALVLGDTKRPLFTSMFHIAIENRSMTHYFSEKLLDCFFTRTVPVYCGCLNLEKYFNIEGVIIVKNVDEIINVCNNLTEKDYWDRRPAMEDNYRLAQPRADYMEQLKNKITDILKSI